MTALAAARQTRSKLNNGDRYVNRVIAAGETIYPGALVGMDASGNLEAATATSPRIIGWSDPDNGNQAATETIRVLEGAAYWEQTGTTITDAHIGLPVYCADDQTVTLDKGAGDAPEVGIVSDVNASGVLVLTEHSVNSALKNRPVIQSGVATLALGTIDVDTTIELRTTSRIFLTHNARPTGSTNYAGLVVAARTDGAKATAAFTIEAVVAAGTIDSDAAGAVNWMIVG
jgi:hypothetical protein